MTERTIVLSDEDAAALDRLVEEYGYRDEAEALHESLKLVELAQTSIALREAAFHAAIQAGLDDLEAGRLTRFASAQEAADFFALRRRSLLSKPEA